ncbi:hypothetical protein [Bosea sp. Tri-44]|uniref:hypothetical protein n=1 Tax=Bosea sp. Tri-44 TaxID=1972137 RepID=UPI00100F21B8|nr:hypothetical protein [Bosea sp. Tri-44]
MKALKLRFPAETTRTAIALLIVDFVVTALIPSLFEDIIFKWIIYIIFWIIIAAYLMHKTYHQEKIIEFKIVTLVFLFIGFLFVLMAKKIEIDGAQLLGSTAHSRSQMTRMSMFFGWYAAYFILWTKLFWLGPRPPSESLET